MRIEEQHHQSPMQATQKFLQRKLYTFLETKWGVSVCILGLFWMLHTLVTLLQVLASQSGPLPTPGCLYCSNQNFADNIGGKFLGDKLCYPPIDAVYTWVNGSDERLQELLAKYKIIEGITPPPSANATMTDANQDKVSGNRYRDNEELRYSLRSLYHNAPWLRHIYVVTNGQIPHWLNIDHPRLTLIPHSQLYPDPSHLPVFSSPSIESHLHRIPGLADYFVYFNDDVFLGNEVWPDDFITQGGGQKVYLSWEVPPCAAGCPEAWVGDNYCDVACNVSACHYDGGDCLNGTRSRYGGWGHGRGAWSGRTNVWQPQKNRYCSYGCPNNWVGDKVCDRACKNAECGFDGGDCGDEDIAAELFGVRLFPDTTNVLLPENTKAFYVNFSDTFDGKILEASHDNPDFVRTAIVTQKLKILTVLLFDDRNDDGPIRTSVEILLGGERFGNQTTITFNVTMPLSAAPPPKQTNTTDDDTLSDDSGRRNGHPANRSSYISERDSARRLDEIKYGATRKLLSWNSFNDNHQPDTMSVTLERDILPEDDPLGRYIPVGIESIPSTDDVNTSESVAITGDDDVELAKHILDSKIKQLKQFRAMDIRLAFDEAVAATSAELAGQNTIWPWEVEVRDPMPVPVGQPRRRLTGRHLLDTFGDSLRYVNQLYNKEFGKEARKVPAHMPHFIQKPVMDELQKRFADRFERTSSHRFRHSEDMQFSFSYFYYIMNSKLTFDMETMFAERLDLNGNGELDEAEVRNLAVLLHDRGSTTDKDVDDLTVKLRNATLQGLDDPIGDFDPNSISRDYETLLEVRVPISAYSIILAEDVFLKLKEHVESKKRFKYELMPQDEIEFYMIGDNDTRVQDRLDHVTRKQPKFICLNDDVKGDDDQQVYEKLQTFFRSYFPHPSPFELPESQYHTILHFDDLMAHRASSQNTQIVFMLGSVACVLAVLVLAYRVMGFRMFTAKQALV